MHFYSISFGYQQANTNTTLRIRVGSFFNQIIPEREYRKTDRNKRAKTQTKQNFCAGLNKCELMQSIRFDGEIE